MKYTILSIVGLLGLSLLASEAVFAQGMMGYWNSPLHNATLQDQQQEEQEGQLLLDDLSNQTVTCSQLSDADFEKIGEYFRGRIHRGYCTAHCDE